MSKLSRGSCRVSSEPPVFHLSGIRRLLCCSWYRDAEQDAVAGWETSRVLEETEHSNLDSSYSKLNHSSLALTPRSRK